MIAWLFLIKNWVVSPTARLSIIKGHECYNCNHNSHLSSTIIRFSRVQTSSATTLMEIAMKKMDIYCFVKHHQVSLFMGDFFFNLKEMSARIVKVPKSSFREQSHRCLGNSTSWSVADKKIFWT